MEAFDEIDVAPELVEALAAEGIERYLHSFGHVVPLVAWVRGFVTRAMDAWQTLRPEANEIYQRRMDAHLAGLPLVQGG